MKDKTIHPHEGKTQINYLMVLSCDSCIYRVDCNLITEYDYCDKYEHEPPKFTTTTL